MRNMRSGRVKQLVRKDGPLVAMCDDATIAAAAQSMSDRNVGSVLVFDAAGKFGGIVTERDILKKVAAKGLDAARLRLADILTSDVVTCTMESAISTVEELMHWHKIRHIPVIEDGRPVAILSSRDIIAYQISRSKDMKLAAEQIARMSIELKSSNFDQLASWAVKEVTGLFSSQSAVLWVEPDEEAANSGGFMAQWGCHCRVENISAQVAACQAGYGPAFVPIQAHSDCQTIRQCTHALVVPLKISACTESAKPGMHMKCGFVCVCGLERRGLEDDEVVLYKASLLSEILSAGLTNAHLYREYSEARNQSLTDLLTGLGTRRLLEAEMDNEYIRAKRYGHPFCIAVMDIDKFKLINDTEGHAAGDEALKRVARVVQKTRRATDIAVRYGGDELVLLMPETDKAHGMMVAERLRAMVEEGSGNGGGSRVTISCGLAEWASENDGLPMDVFQRADNALYQAKQSGRNRVCAASPEAVGV
ncbi:MAG TPA: GGDEF domain-containing protein [Sedimentisphaerales bacterium]|nr:GGDEF domain-containing protein [Sedimentisphaerales bacterium]